MIDEGFDANRDQQIKNLLVRIDLIRYMQLFGILAFIACIILMTALLIGFQKTGTFAFGSSMLFMFLSLGVAFAEVAKSGDGLRLEIERTRAKINNEFSEKFK